MAMADNHPESGSPWVGRSIARVEDSALLSGRGRFIDDIGVDPGTLHAAFLRSPHAHADIVSIDVTQARQARGVVAVLDGEDIKALTSSLVVGVKAPVECWPMAVGRVRYVGEPVAIVVATDRYCAEDAVDLIDVRYAARPAVIDPRAALSADAPVLHDGFGGNVASDRSFRYGDPEQAFASAPHRISIDVSYPRNSCTPIETYGVVADYDPGEDAYDVLANFQGPFSIHAVLSRALKVPGNRLRLRTPPDSGGSFGVKQGVFPYIVLIAAAARASGRPVKWIEDRLEHLTASVSATNRAISLAAAVTEDGRILALDWDQVEDCGAHLRAPEPATLYRMHGNLSGAYDIRHLKIRNRVVVTNKTPTGLNRGFGGPQVYFALERLVQRIALELGLDPLDVITRNLVAADAFPYRTASGALLDSGNYQEAIRRAVQEGALDRAQGTPGCGPRGRPSLRYRLHGRGRAQRVQYGLHHDRADAGRAAQGGSQEWRAGDRDGRDRSGRECDGSCCLRAARAGPSHRTVAGRRRRVRAEAFRYPGQYRDRYREGRLVDCVRKLCQPFRARGGRHRQACGRAHRRAAAAHRGEPVEYGNRRHRVRRTVMSDRSAIPTTSCRSRALLRSVTGRRARCPMASDTPSARPCSGRRRN